MLPVLATETIFIHPNLNFFIDLLYTIALGTVISYPLFFKILSKMPASEFSSYLFLVPVLTTIIGVILQWSLPSWNEVAGTLLVALGIIVANR